MSSPSFTFNIAYSVPINKDPAQPTLTLQECWRGLRRGGEKPHLFAEYVADTEILPNRKSENEFQRKLIMANGAVHTAKGVELIQDVRNADNLLVSGARKAILLFNTGIHSIMAIGSIHELTLVLDGSDYRGLRCEEYDATIPRRA